jgi:hypothetical protein
VGLKITLCSVHMGWTDLETGFKFAGISILNLYVSLLLLLLLVVVGCRCCCGLPLLLFLVVASRGDVKFCS